MIVMRATSGRAFFDARFEAARFTETTAAIGYPIPDHNTPHTVPGKKLNARSERQHGSDNLRLSAVRDTGPTAKGVSLDWSNIRRCINMNSLFLGILTLFFAQGLLGRDHRSARGMSLLLVAGFFSAFIYSL